MFTKSSILAGEIIQYLEEAQRSVSIGEFVYFLEQPYHHVQAAVAILIHEGIAVLDFQEDVIRLVKVPETVWEDIQEQKFLEMETASI